MTGGSAAEPMTLIVALDQQADSASKSERQAVVARIKSSDLEIHILHISNSEKLVTHLPVCRRLAIISSDDMRERCLS